MPTILNKDGFKFRFYSNEQRSAIHQNGFIVVRMASGAEIRFPVAENPRLARGTPQQLQNIEISPYGLHWPDLDEDLSFQGLLEGNHGQFQKKV